MFVGAKGTRRRGMEGEKETKRKRKRREQKEKERSSKRRSKACKSLGFLSPN